MVNVRRQLIRKYIVEIFLTLLVITFALLLRGIALNAVPRQGALPRLVLLYVPCTVNSNYLAPYNPTVPYTPNLADFAARSLTFMRHQTTQSFSGGAYASLFTGTYPDRHLVYFHPSRLNPESYTVAEAFRDNGYETFFWTVHALASPELNYAKGISSKNITRKVPDGRILTKFDKRFMAILERLENDPNYKAFIQVNFSVTHAPYTAFSKIDRTRAFCKLYPTECSGVSDDDLDRYSRIYAENHVALSFRWAETSELLKKQGVNIDALIRVVDIIYKSCIHMLDDRFGKTITAIAAMGLLNDSLIVFTSDHGEVLNSRHATVHWWHAQLEPEILNVPLILHLPQNVRRGQKYENVTRAIDVFPSVASLCKIRLPANITLDGYNLSNSIQGREKEPKLIAFSNTELPNPAAGVDDPRKLVVALRMEDVYYRLSSILNGSKLSVLDQQQDAWKELTSLTSPELKIYTLLTNFRNRLVNPYKHQEPGPDAEEIREKLRSLGYIH